VGSVALFTCWLLPRRALAMTANRGELAALADGDLPNSAG
jgi:hypothetical protein